MKVNRCSPRKVLEPCTTLNFNYQMDTYIGCEHFCYYCYGLNEAETNWESEILIHEDLTGQLARELFSLEPQTIYIGMNSDPYQPVEAEYHQTRKAVELIGGMGFSVSILTKSGMAVKDLDVLKKVPGVSMGISLAFQDETTRKLFEKKVPSNEERVTMLETMKKAGFKTYTLICPVIPLITDIKALIKMAEPHSDAIYIYRLEYMDTESDRNRQNLNSILEKNFTGKAGRIKDIIFSDDSTYWGRVRCELEKLANEIDAEIRLEI